MYYRMPRDGSPIEPGLRLRVSEGNSRIARKPSRIGSAGILRAPLLESIHEGEGEGVGGGEGLGRPRARGEDSDEEMGPPDPGRGTGRSEIQV